MTFRSAQFARESLAVEITRIFDAGAEVRFFAGAQPTDPDPDVTGIWLASRPILASTEPVTEAGQPVTFTAGVFPTAMAYAEAEEAVEALMPRVAAAEASLVVAESSLAAAEAAVVTSRAASNTADQTYEAAGAVRDEKYEVASAAYAAINAARTAYISLTGDLTAYTITAARAAVEVVSAESHLAGKAGVTAGVRNVTESKEAELAAAELTLAQYIATTQGGANSPGAMALESSLAGYYGYRAVAARAQADLADAQGDEAVALARYNVALVANERAIDDLAVYDQVLLLPGVIQAKAELDAAIAAYNTADAAADSANDLRQATFATKQAASNAVYNSNIALGSAESQTTQKTTVLAAAQLALNTQISARDAAGGEGGRALAAIPASGWCRIIHPAYPNVHIDGTFGPEGADADFTVNDSEIHPCLSTLYQLSLTLAVV